LNINLPSWKGQGLRNNLQDLYFPRKSPIFKEKKKENVWGWMSLPITCKIIKIHTQKKGCKMVNGLNFSEMILHRMNAS
jgi:hypothetical protein